MSEPPEAPYDPNAEPPQWGPPPQPGTPQPGTPQPGMPQPGMPQPGGPPAAAPPPWPQPSQPPAPQAWTPPAGAQPPIAAPPPEPSGGWVSPPGEAPPWMQQPTGWEQLGPPMPPQRTRRGRRAPLIAAVAVAAVVGGGTATIMAVSDSHAGFKGAATPEDAVSSFVADLNQADVLGIVDHLPPAERSALLDPLREAVNQAKRLHILDGSANPAHVPGVDVTARNIKYDSGEDEAIGDHVKIVKVVGGTITVNSDLRKVPLAKELVQVIFPGGVVPDQKSSNTVDIAQAMSDNGPLRIATQKVDGKWYPSLLYTIADSAAHDSGADNPTASDYVAPKGAASPEDAVKQAVLAVQKQDYRRLIELAAPDELQVVHDYGGVILNNIKPDPEMSFSVKDLQLASKKVSGATRVSLKSITVDASGHETTVALSDGCVAVTYDGDRRKYCADELIKDLNAGPLRDKPLTPEESAALGRLARGVANSSIDTTQSNGQWYIAALRSYLDGINQLVEPLQSNDVITLLKLLNR